MAFTLNQRLLQLEWWFHEHGGDSIWNELRKIARSTYQGGLTANVSEVGDLDLTTLTATATIPNTGWPIPPGVGLPGWSGTSFATAPQGPPNVTNPPNTSGGETTGEPRVPTQNEP
jgi:hypothetical protein